MSFRTPGEAVSLANDTRYGLAASIWTENVNLALDVAPQVKAGTVWVNCTNLFDAAAGFGGYRESGFGREGGREGLWEYLTPTWHDDAPVRNPQAEAALTTPAGPADAKASFALPGVDRTPKLYIGGRQVRPDAEYALPVHDGHGRLVAQVPRATRKDVRNAVEAARKAQGGWAARSGHNRAQILYFMAENLELRAGELGERLALWHGDAKAARREVDGAVRRLFTWGAWADKYDGLVHHTPFRNVTLAMPEPLGVVGIVAPADAPLLGLVSTLGPALAMGNAAVVLASPAFPLAAVDLVQVLETSDVPPGVVNLLTGTRDAVVPTLADHDDVDGVWVFADAQLCGEVERRSVGNMKRTWCSHGRVRDWTDPVQGEGRDFLRAATQVKNIWVPYGE
jgi:aldehyde dehydrogenase (NAD+)